MRTAVLGAGAIGAYVGAALARGGTEVHLWVKGLPPGAEAVYEVRCERSGWSASAGTFRADADGKVEVKLTTAARVGEYERVRVVTKDRHGTTTGAPAPRARGAPCSPR